MPSNKRNARGSQRSSLHACRATALDGRRATEECRRVVERSTRSLVQQQQPVQSNETLLKLIESVCNPVLVHSIPVTHSQEQVIPDVATCSTDMGNDNEDSGHEIDEFNVRSENLDFEYCCESNHRESEDLNLECEPLNLECETLNLECEALNPECEPLELECEILDLECEDFYLECEDLDLECEDHDREAREYEREYRYLDVESDDENAEEYLSAYRFIGDSDSDLEDGDSGIGDLNREDENERYTFGAQLVNGAHDRFVNEQGVNELEPTGTTIQFIPLDVETVPEVPNKKRWRDWMQVPTRCTALSHADVIIQERELVRHYRNSLPIERAEDLTDESQAKHQCTICMVKEATRVISPCGHPICTNCMTHMVTHRETYDNVPRAKKCGVCLMAVGFFLRVY